MADWEETWRRLPRQLQALLLYLPLEGSSWPEEERDAWLLLCKATIERYWPVKGGAS